MKAFSVEISFLSATQGNACITNHLSDDATGSGTSDYFDPGPNPDPLPAFICD